MKTTKKILIAAILAIIFSITNQISYSAYADNETGWIGEAETSGGGGNGNNTSGGSACSDADKKYRVDCAGVSWLFYASINDDPEDAEDIKFPIHGNAKGIAVSYSDAKIPAVCAKHTNDGGGFWHFGINAFPGSGSILLNFYNGQTIDYGNGNKWGAMGNSEGTSGHWETVRYGFYRVNLAKWETASKKLLIPNTEGYHKIENLYQSKPSKSSDYESVLADYQAAWKGAHPGYNEADIPSSIPDGVYAFCWWENIDNPNPDFYSKSYVSNRRETQSTGESDWVDTNIVNTKTSKTTSPEPRRISLGEDVNITFTHNVYATTAETDIAWKVVRSMNGGNFVNDEKYEIVPNAESGISSGGLANEFVPSSPAKSSTMPTENNGKTYYAGEPQNYTDGEKEYILRDYYTIKFKATGRYKFCESVYLADATDYNTQVCTDIEVVDGPIYYGKSNVRVAGSNGEEDYSTTDISQNATTTVSIDIEVGNSASIIFFHDGYSNIEIDEDIKWSVTRIGSFTFIDSSAGTAKSGEDAFTERYMDYYTPSDDTKGYTDGTYKYLYRETFDNKIFNTPGKYSFCENIKVNLPNDDGEVTGQTATTTACAVINVKPKNQNNPSQCSEWAPPSYTSSQSKKEGRTSVLSAVKDSSYMADYSKVRNEGEDDPSNNAQKSLNIFAKPGDAISWTNCYYAGVQKLANNTLVGLNGAEYVSGQTSHGSHKSCSCTSNTYKAFKKLITWEKEFKVASTTDAFRNGIFSQPNSFLTKVGSEFGSGSFDSANYNSTFRTYGLYNYNVNLKSTIGTADVKMTSNNYNVNAINDVGHVYAEEISTAGNPYRAKYWTETHTITDCCPCCGEYCSCCNPVNDHCSAYSDGDSWSGPLSAKTSVTIPYNFINTTSVEIKRGASDLVFAGDLVTVDTASITVNKKENSLVGNATYATQVDNARAVLVAYVSDQDETTKSGNNIVSSELSLSGNRGADFCNIASSWAKTSKQCMTIRDNTIVLNYDDAFEKVLEGGTEEGNFKILNDNNNNTRDTEDYSTTYRVFDASAGDFMCFAMAVYPSASGANDNLNPEGNYKWALSKTCIKIAKKPTFQVLGGNFFENSKITTSTSTKYNLYNIQNYAYAPLSGASTHFGSWAEEAVIANGKITDFASGAAIAKNGERANGRDLYGAKNNDYYNKWIPLTFANYSDSGRISGEAKISSGTKERAALVNYLQFNHPDDYREESDGYHLRTTDLGTGENNRGETLALRVNGDLYIDGNITYANESYSSMSAVPQAVLYANNIHISCDVSRLDAILIAEDTVFTCDSYYASDAKNREAIESPSSDINDATRSKYQLVVTGAIIATKLELARTYGTAVGVESGTAAEVINYDTSSLVWGRAKADAGESDTLTTVYVHELAPRY